MNYVFLLLFVFAIACSSDDTSTGDDMGVNNVNNVNNQNNVNNVNNQNNVNNVNNVNNSNNANNSNNSNNANNSNNSNNANNSNNSNNADMGTDMADMGSDMTAGAGCAPGATLHEGVDSDIVACEAATAQSLNQCQASALCGQGWHMCTATEYRAKYETVFHPETENATYWLAGCVRDGAAPTSPANNVCADCTGTQTGGTEDVGFSCVNAITLTADSLYVGVRAGSACSFVGLNQAGNDAFWSVLPAASAEDGAFCCRD